MVEQTYKSAAEESIEELRNEIDSRKVQLATVKIET